MAKVRTINGPSGPLRAGDDVTALLERVESMEGHFGVNLGALSAWLAETYQGSFGVTVHGEARRVGPTPEKRLMVVCAVHDLEGRVLNHEETWLDAELLEFQTFGVDVGLPPRASIGTVKVYPKNI